MEKLNFDKLMIFILIILFLILSVFMKAELLNRFDMVFYSEITEHMSSFLTNVMKTITYLGNSITILTICIILIIIPKLRIEYGTICSIGVIISTISNITLKIIFARPRPDILRLINETNYSFPSGHAMINATFYFLIGICIYKYVKDNKKYLLLGICLFMPIIIGISRVYLGVHYITDVIGGWMLGSAIAIGIYYIYNKLNQYKR